MKLKRNFINEWAVLNDKNEEVITFRIYKDRADDQAISVSYCPPQELFGSNEWCTWRPEKEVENFCKETAEKYLKMLRAGIDPNPILNMVKSVEISRDSSGNKSAFVCKLKDGCGKEDIVLPYGICPSFLEEFYYMLFRNYNERT